MTALAYRAAGAVCCLIAIGGFGIGLYWVGQDIPMQGKILAGASGAINSSFFGVIGVKFLLNGGPIND